MSAVQSNQSLDLSLLYEQDETAWLDLSVRLIEAGRRDELDYDNLCEFLGTRTFYLSGFDCW